MDAGGAFSDEISLLHEEVCRLPEKYRAVVVLCDLESYSHEAAARQLDWPVGSVKGRLFRARNLLRDRLVRRGVTLSAGAIASSLANEARGAIVAPGLLDATVKAGVGFAAGQTVAAGLISATSVALYQGVHHAMFVSKLKVAGALMAAGVVVVGSGALAHQKGGAGEGKEVQTQQKLPPAPDGPPPLHASGEKVESQAPENHGSPRLQYDDLTMRNEIAKQYYDAALARFESGQGLPIAETLDASRRWMEAESEFAKTRASLEKAYRAYLDRSNALLEQERKRFDLGLSATTSVLAAELAVADAKLRLSRLNNPELLSFPRRTYVDIHTEVQETPTRAVSRDLSGAAPKEGNSESGASQPFGIPSEITDELTSARRQYQSQSTRYQRGEAMAKRVIDASERLVAAERRLKKWVDQNASDPRRHLDQMRRLLDEERLKPGGGDEENLKLIEAAVARAEGDFLAWNRPRTGGTVMVRDVTIPGSNPAASGGREMGSAGTVTGAGNAERAEVSGQQVAQARDLVMLQMMEGMSGRGRGATKAPRLEEDRALETENEEDKAKNELIRQTLLQKLPMPFGQPTPLDDIFKYVKTSTTSKILPTGLPIYLDPTTLEEKRMSEVMIDLDGVPLKTTLRLVLRQVNLGYYIRDGLLMVVPLNSTEYRYRDRSADPQILGVPFENTRPRPDMATPTPETEAQ